MSVMVGSSVLSVGSGGRWDDDEARDGRVGGGCGLVLVARVAPRRRHGRFLPRSAGRGRERGIGGADAADRSGPRRAGGSTGLGGAPLGPGADAVLRAAGGLLHLRLLLVVA